MGASIWSISILSSTFFGGEMQFLWQDQNKSHVPNFTKRYCVGASFWLISILSSTFFGVDTSGGVSSFSDPSQLSNIHISILLKSLRKFLSPGLLNICKNETPYKYFPGVLKSCYSMLKLLEIVLRLKILRKTLLNPTVQLTEISFATF